MAEQVTVMATDVSMGSAVAGARKRGAAWARIRVRLVQADLSAGIRGPIHVLLANLPYVPSSAALAA